MLLVVLVTEVGVLVPNLTVLVRAFIVGVLFWKCLLVLNGLYCYMSV